MFPACDGCPRVVWCTSGQGTRWLEDPLATVPLRPRGLLPSPSSTFRYSVKSAQEFQITSSWTLFCSTVGQSNGVLIYRLSQSREHYLTVTSTYQIPMQFFYLCGARNIKQFCSPCTDVHLLYRIHLKFTGFCDLPTWDICTSFNEEIRA